MVSGQTHIDKPQFGQSCNGCGLCCRIVPCVIARDLLKAFEGPCPALEHDQGRYWCGLLRNPHKHIYGMADKPWIDGPIITMMKNSGAWNGLCDSGPSD
jgi:hypothetical protein